MPITNSIHSWAWWYIPVIPAPRRLRQEDCKFKVSLGYIVRPSLKKKKREEENKRKKERNSIYY
jgi:hypothetical protein